MTEQDEVRIRLAAVEADLTMIRAQFHDPTYTNDPDWRRRARYAKAHKTAEQKELKARLAALDSRRQADAREARAQRQAVANEERTRKDAVLLSATQEQQLILRLTTALGRLYRKAGMRASPEDAALLERAAGYCEDKGLFG